MLTALLVALAPRGEVVLRGNAAGAAGRHALQHAREAEPVQLVRHGADAGQVQVAPLLPGRRQLVGVDIAKGDARPRKWRTPPGGPRIPTRSLNPDDAPARAKFVVIARALELNRCRAPGRPSSVR